MKNSTMAEYTDNTKHPLGNLKVLAPELRNEIYRHVFYQGYVVPCRHLHAEDNSKARYDTTSFAILRTSKQIAQEASAILYRYSYFEINTCIEESQMQQLAKGIIPNIEQLKLISIRYELFVSYHWDNAQADHDPPLETFQTNLRTTLDLLETNAPKDTLLFMLPLSPSSKEMKSFLQSFIDELKANGLWCLPSVGCLERV